MNVQVISTPDGDPVWVSGSVHDLKAARIWQILTEHERYGWITLGDKGYQGATALLTPYKGKDKPASQKATNRAHARLRGHGERAIAQLKSWRVLAKLRCCPYKAGRLAKAIHVLQDREIHATHQG